MTTDTTTFEGRGTIQAGWCPDCDLPSAVVDARDGVSAWAECSECGAGWVHREEPVQRTAPRGRRRVQRAA